MSEFCELWFGIGATIFTITFLFLILSILKEAEMSDFKEYKPMEEEYNIQAAVENLRKAYWSNETKKVAKIFTDAEDIIISSICHHGYTVSKENADRWISIKTRPLTEEEKQNAIEKHDIDPDDLEYPFAWHFDCELPELKEGEQSVDVLVTTYGGFVKATNFFIDYLGCPCFEDMDVAGEFVAWMPLPKAYESEAAK